MNKKEYLKSVKRIVVKIGSSTLTHETGLLNLYRIEKIVRQLADLSNQGYEVILVSSGAIGAGMGKLNLDERPKTIPEKQALAAVGQVALIHIYQKYFSEYGKDVAQVLLTGDGISNRERYLNARNAFFTLFEYGVIPIVNENDAVVVDEIKVGENDTLSALVASLVDADLLIILSDIDGMFTANPQKDPDAKLIEVVEEINDEIRAMAGGSGSKFGTGGMATKIKAAEISVDSGTSMVIAKGDDPENIYKVVKGENIGTLFLKNDNKLNAKKHWIIYSSKKEGEIIVDSGAVKALTKHKSLLPSGIKEIKGNFEKGNTVSVVSDSGEKIAVGLVNYSSSEINLIKGKKTKEIFNILSYKDYDEVIHINNMYIARGEK